MHSQQDTTPRVSFGRAPLFPIGRMKQTCEAKFREGQVFAEEVLIWWFVPIGLVGIVTGTWTVQRRVG